MIRSLCRVAMQYGISERHSPYGASLESRRCYFCPRQGKPIPSSAFATQSRTHCRVSYSIKLRYEARASISFGDNLFAILGMGSAAA
jgi:hypothetical protein